MIYYIWYTIYYIWYIIYYTLYTIYCTLYTIYTILYIVYIYTLYIHIYYIYIHTIHTIYIYTVYDLWGWILLTNIHWGLSQFINGESFSQPTMNGTREGEISRKTPDWARNPAFRLQFSLRRKDLILKKLYNWGEKMVIRHVFRYSCCTASSFLQYVECDNWKKHTQELTCPNHSHIPHFFAGFHFHYGCIPRCVTFLRGRIPENEREDWMPIGRAGDELFCFQVNARKARSDRSNDQTWTGNLQKTPRN